MSHTIVVSHYRENLDWLWTLPDDITKVIIYHKGDRLDLIPKNHPMVEVHTLPNIGREGHTILYHILIIIITGKRVLKIKKKILKTIRKIMTMKRLIV